LTCTKCNIEKPQGDFSRSKVKRNGRHSYCKECFTEYQHEHYLSNLDKIKEYRRQPDFKAKAREYHIKYYADNKENLLARRKEAWHSNPEIQKKWRGDNRDKVLAYKKNYRLKNSGKVNAAAMKRIADRNGLTPPWVDLKEVEHFYITAKMMEEETGIKYHVDHIHPLNGDGFNGLHVPWNLQILEASDNLTKGNRLIGGLK